MRTFSVAAFLLAVTLAPAAAQVDLERPNSVFWTMCQGGIADYCPVLVTDAAAGDPEAQFRLAVLLMMDGPLGKDEKMGLRWLIESAKQRHPPAVRYARMLVNESPIPDTPRREPAPAPRRAPQLPLPDPQPAFPRSPPVLAQTG